MQCIYILGPGVSSAVIFKCFSCSDTHDSTNQLTKRPSGVEVGVLGAGKTWTCAGQGIPIRNPNLQFSQWTSSILCQVTAIYHVRNFTDSGSPWLHQTSINACKYIIQFSSIVIISLQSKFGTSVPLEQDSLCPMVRLWTPSVKEK